MRFLEQLDMHTPLLELLQIQNSPSQFFEGTQLFSEILVYSSSDDLVGVKQTLDGIEKMAKRFKSWAPILFFARGEYQRIRGDYKSALFEIEKALGSTAPGRHIIWPQLAGVYINILFELGRLEEAKEEGRKLLGAAEKENIGIGRNIIRRALALAEAKLGEHESAVKRLEAAIEQLKSLGVTGLYLGSVYETRARVAVVMNDDERFRIYAKLCAEQYQAGHNPALTAKYEKLVQEARRAKLGVSDDVARAADFSELSAETVLTLVAGMLVDCKGPQERAERVLELLIRQSNCAGGFLYTMQQQGPALSAKIGDRPAPAEMDSMVKTYIAAELDDAKEVTLRNGDPEDSSDKTSEWTNRQGEKYRPVLLGHGSEAGFTVTGLAVLLVSPDKLFNFPHGIVSALSKILLDTGDVVTACGS